MADAPAKEPVSEQPTPKKSSKLPLILGLVLAVLGGSGGFMAVKLGLLGGAKDEAQVVATTPVRDMAAVAFVPIDPLIINLPPNARSQHLRFAAQLEVDPAYAAEVEGMKPRVIDVLNGYLRSVDIADLEDPTVLIKLRAQMLRRVQVVVGEGRVRDLLIMEFVLN